MQQRAAASRREDQTAKATSPNLRREANQRADSLVAQARRQAGQAQAPK